MQDQFIGTVQALDAPRTRRPGLRVATGAALVLVCSVLFPAIPILLGVLLIVAVAIHAASKDLRPYVEHLLRMPIARASKRHARLSLAAGAGVLFVVSGAVGATIRGQVRGEWEQRQSRREVAREGVAELLGRAAGLLAAGDVEGAELVLLDANAIATTDSEEQEEVEDLLERVVRSGDSKVILDVLVRLPEKEFEAFQEGTLVPEALEFPERALTLRAVELALAQLEEARAMRASR